MMRIRVAATLIAMFASAAALAAEQWVGSWAASQQAAEERNALPDTALTDATLRQIVHLSIGGHRARVLLSNVFGTSPLRIDAAHIALAKAANSQEIVPATDRALAFDGRSDVIIPAGAAYWSDPVSFDAEALANVAITIHFPAAPQRQTIHPGSRATSYLAHGNHVGDRELADESKVERWLQISGVSVDASANTRAVVTFGDSITDGHGATTDGNDRWPDVLAARLQKDSRYRSVAVLNHGIGGNRLLLDGSGPNGLARFDRDVLAQPGVRYVIVLEGINDLGMLTRDAPVSVDEHSAHVARVIGAYRQMIDRAHAASLKIYGATVLPDGKSDFYHPDARNEADRQAINAWIRSPGHFDAVIDFDAVVRDPTDPKLIAAKFDCGDGLHPSPAGYRAMAEAIPLELFK